ncbi:iron uptake porin [Candidatus Synechococcus calcipolaris G9]|uniref:Iron uptake porin n=1 Tax=Candidatus Synechococcus calcipolaris G9 TaxID=1497997 RepID=A0ABT6F0N0_9SYNE|nr:iron uptake porin [Candidatus Synechococcus calcipolaris]MDG2991381.1 iron uptake porin [Candidatus Synechococcus calcipolaris G9]
MTSRFFGKLLLASPLFFVLNSLITQPARAVDHSQNSFWITETELQGSIDSQEQLSLLEPSSLRLAQRQTNRATPTPSVAELEGGPVVNPAPAQPHRQNQGLGVRRQMPQVTSVNQLSDVRPTDWAYQALASLVEKYGCIAGYPDGTFRGNRAATRYELAAALNACLDVISDRFATKEDLAALRKLMEEFAAELALVQGRVTNLEGRVSNLEATQFATITRLRGTAIFNVSDILAGGIAPPAVPGSLASTLNYPINDNTVFSYRTRLNIETSFYGKDTMRIRLQAANMPAYQAVTGTNMVRLGNATNTGGAFALGDFWYRFPIGDRLRVAFNFNAGALDKNVFLYNPLIESGDTGAISRFGRYNPIFRMPGGNAAGVSLRYTALQNKDAGTGIDLNVSYMAPNPASPNTVSPTAGGFGAFNSGLFGGAYAALAQVDVRPVKNFAFGLTYIRSFGVDPTGGTGSSFAAAAYPNSGYPAIGVLNPAPNTPITGNGLANNPTGNGGGVNNIAADNFGFQFTYRVMPKLTLSGWTGYTNARAVQGQANGRSAEVLNWALTAAAPDLWNKGDVLGLVFGQPPQMISSQVNGAPPSTFDTYHIEGFYRFRFTPNIAVTPGIITVINPNSNASNSPIILGVVRTTFSF